MAHATHMAAMNAARKQFGKDWKAAATLEKVDGQWYVQVIQKEEPTPAIPALPAALTAPAIEEPAPATPILPAFLQEAPQAPAEVPAPEAAAAQAAGDAAANDALTANPFNNVVCPCCKSEELFTGRVDDATGIVTDEEFIIGCHHCDWYVDTRTLPNAVAPTKTGALRPRISTTDKPTKKVWAIADSMPGKKRKEVIEACVAAGIAYGTARTQYQHWFKCVADQKVAPLAVIGADGAITIINQGDAVK